jgi:hypothetical protein
LVEGDNDLLCREIKIRSYPSLAASATRCSMRLVGRISPDKPTSPAKQVPFGIGLSTSDDKIAQITARSTAGSITLIACSLRNHLSLPPGTLPAFQDRSQLFKRRIFEPVVERCGVP